MAGNRMAGKRYFQFLRNDIFLSKLNDNGAAKAAAKIKK
jgi:hypothetical protein